MSGLVHLRKALYRRIKILAIFILGLIISVKEEDSALHQPVCLQSITFTYNCVLSRLSAATIRSSLRLKAKWSRSYSANSATSISSWRIIQKASDHPAQALFRMLLICFNSAE